MTNPAKNQVLSASIRVNPRLLLLFVFSAFVSAASLAKEAVPMAADEQVEQRLISISEEMRCLVCQNETLAGSHAELAEDLRREIREQIKQGKTNEDIMSYMVSRYGDFIRYRPPLKATTLLLWFGPGLALLLGIAVLLAYLRRRNARLSDVALTPEEQSKVDLLLQAGIGQNKAQP